MDNLILVEHFCYHHDVEIFFIDALQEQGLITIAEINEKKYLPIDTLKEIEMMTDFYYNLGINIEGIDVIKRLLAQNASLRQELDVANKKLHIFIPEMPLE